jgi:glycosyltransferase involved in cell wall biosynthesis
MIFFYLLLFLTTSLHAAVEFVIVTASYNNEAYCMRHLESIASQTYPHWSLIYINDCSQDRTGLLVEQFVHSNLLTKRCKVIHNRKRTGAMANIYSACHLVEPKKVIICVDGDDALSDPHVLEKLAKVYEDTSVWMTYGNYRTDPICRPSVCRPFAKEVYEKCSFRSVIWSSSHPKTFYAALFHKIKEKDLKTKGKFFDVASDVAFMLPMLEMASFGHIRFISEVLYIYNYQNPLNDTKQKLNQVLATEAKIRAKTPYNPLQRLF